MRSSSGSGDELADDPTTSRPTARAGRARTPSTRDAARATAPGRRTRSTGACWRMPGVASSACSPRRRRQGRRRARLRDRVLLGAGCAPRRARRSASTSRPRSSRPRGGMQRGVRARVPAGRGERRGRAAPGRVVRPRRLRVRRVDLVRPVPLDPGGRAAAPARRRARLPRNGDAPRSSAAQDAGDPSGRAAPYARTSGCTASSGPTTPAVEFHLGYGDWIRLLRANGFEVEDLIELQAPGRRAAAPYYDALPDRRVGAQVAVRGDLARPQARVSAPPAPPLLLASTSPQRRAILEQLRIPFDVVAAGLRGAAGRRSGRARASARRGRCSPRPATGPCSASTPRSSRRATSSGSRESDDGRGGDARGARRPDARGRLRALPAHARLGGGRTTRSTRVTFRPLDAARPRALRREPASGRAAPAPTRSRASAPRSSSGSRATT